MTNSANGIKREIKVKEQQLGAVTSLKYLGAVSQIKAQNRRFSLGLIKLLQH